ncbi:MAG: hypothetical protein PUC18_13030 [Prevotellaceae bacterium]|nr:hypothetical protein [Prevotellaceae bacterium]
MESEFLKDLQDLEVAFQMHVEKDETTRSIVIIASDGNVSFTKIIGKKEVVINSMLNSFMGDQVAPLASEVIAGYHEIVSLPRAKKFLFGGVILQIMVVVWSIVLLALWWFVDLSMTSLISNLLLMGYTFFYIRFTSKPIWKKVRRVRVMKEEEDEQGAEEDKAETIKEM